VSVVSRVSIEGGISLGGSIKTLGDGVETSAGSKRNSCISNRGGVWVGSIESISISFSISRPLAKVVSVVSRVSIEGGISLGGSIKSLGDGVETSAGAKGNSGISDRGSVRVSSIESISISISRPLAKVVSIVSSIPSISGKSSSLGHRVKSLSDWVKTSAGAKWNTSIGIREPIPIGKVGSISISISPGSSHQASKEECLDHVPN